MVWLFGNYRRLFLLCWLFTLNTPAKADPSPGIKFIENKNQWSEEIHFSARVPGGRMFIRPGGFNYYFLDEAKLQALHEHSHNDVNESDGAGESDGQIDGSAVSVRFIGANTSLTPSPFGRSSEYYNYFLGTDTCRWAANAYAYSGFIYPSLYAGVDLKVYSSGNSIKYDFIVAPNSDASAVRLEYQGADELEIDPSGDLLVKTTLGSMIEKKPVAYQFIDGRKVFVACRYVLSGNQLSFSFSEGYDPCYELVIDPLLIFSTYSGSTADNWGSTATPGEHGKLYSAGVTNLGNYGGTFPATSGAFQVNYGGLYDIGILKYDSTGQQLLYATYLGGTGTESAHSLVMNSKNELVVLGTTGSADFPTTLNAFDRSFNGGVGVTGIVVPYFTGTDVFVARISPAGNHLLASTLLGGTQNDGLNPLYGALEKNYGDQLRGDVITDDDGNIFISTVTSSPDFPAVNSIDNSYNGGPTDAVIAMLDEDLTQIKWSTFLGGSQTDGSLTLKFDESKNIFVAGGTNSTDFPVSANAYQTQLGGDADGWIASIKPDGTTIIQATFTGTSAFDQVYFLDLNANDEVYVYGQTAGNFPVTPGVYSNPNSGQFIQKFNTSLTSLLFSTVVGSGRGTPDISPTAFLVNECNNLYLAGWGGAINIQSLHWQGSTFGMPITSDAFQKTTSGSDFYFMVLTDDASQLLYGTYLGGTLSRTHVDGGTSRFDKGGIVYHAVCSGCRVSTNDRPDSDFPTTPGAWSATNNSGNCNNAAFKFDLSSLKARLQSNSVALDMPGLNKVCIPDKIVFQNFSIGGEIFEWDLGDGTRVTKTDTSMIIHEYPATGNYTVWLKAIDRGTCKGKDSVSLKVDVFIAETLVQDDDEMCFNTPYTLQASGGATYQWTSEDGDFQSTSPNPVVNPKDTTRYFIVITEASGCIQDDTVQLNVIPLIEPEFEMDRSAECFERPSIRAVSTTDSLKEGDRLYFDFGDGSTSDATEVEHDFEADGLYSVKLIAVREFCVTEKILPMPVFKLKIPNIITPGRNDDTNDKFTIQLGDLPGVTPLTYGFKTSVIIYNRWGSKVFEAQDYQFDWDGDSLAAGIYFYEVTVDGHATCKSWIQLVK